MTTKFHPPNQNHHNPDIIKAVFDIDTGVPSQQSTGFILVDGSCTCGEAKIGGSCRHMRDWRQHETNEAALSATYADELRDELERQREADADHYEVDSYNFSNEWGF